jgi:hypothetical protein
VDAASTNWNYNAVVTAYGRDVKHVYLNNHLLFRKKAWNVIHLYFLGRRYDFQNSLAKKLVFVTQNNAMLLHKSWITALVFKKSANVFAENRQKSLKLAISG